MNSQIDSLRWPLRGAALVLAALVIILLNVLPIEPVWVARFLVDKNELTHEPNYWAAQNFMWVFFFLGLAELLLIFLKTNKQAEELDLHYLPEDDSTVLLKSDMPKVHQCVIRAGRQGMLGEMVRLVASQFQSTGSVAMCSSVMNANLELKQHEIDLQYNFVRYITWLLPSLGFIGTVWGILQSLEVASGMGAGSDAAAKLPEVIAGLSVAFWTTLLALLMSCVIMLVTHVVQTREERVLNRSMRYCLNNLINRLLER